MFSSDFATRFFAAAGALALSAMVFATTIIPASPNATLGLELLA